MSRATFFDPAAAQALMPQVDPDDKEAVAKANYERIKAQTALAKFIWPIWDKGLKKRIHRIKAPTLLVWGDSDGLVPPAYAAEFKRRIPGSQLTIMAKTGHVPMVERREEFARIVTDFFKA
jgi:pimeloyl-ACP methyl ester carboxylesterase